VESARCKAIGHTIAEPEENTGKPPFRIRNGEKGTAPRFKSVRLCPGNLLRRGLRYPNVKIICRD